MRNTDTWSARTGETRVSDCLRVGLLTSVTLSCWPALVATALLVACGPSDQQKNERADQKRIACLDKICAGDVVPKHDSLKEFALKLNGQWFIGPREYGGYGGSLHFYWPSKAPASSERASAPEFDPGGAGRVSNYYDVAIEIFLRSNNIPPEPTGFALIQMAEANGWITSRKVLRPGLEAIQMKHVIGPTGHFIETYYVATDLKGVDGLPPVATCAHDVPDGGGGTGFMWRPGIWVGTGMNQRHCADWPETHQEVMRVLQLIRKALEA